MSRKNVVKSDILSGIGAGFEILKALKDEIDRQGGNGDECLRKIKTDKSLREKIAELLVGNTATSEAAAPVTTAPIISAPREWREEDGVIYFSVTSNGMKGEEWIAHLQPKGRGLSGYAKSVLRSKDFKPTSGITYRVAVLKGTLFSDCDRVTSKIRFDAKDRKLKTPNAEVACLIRDKFSDEDIEAMGLWWVITMHDPIKDSGGGLCLLGAGRNVDGYSLDACHGYGDTEWCGRDGFAFVLLQE